MLSVFAAHRLNSPMHLEQFAVIVDDYDDATRFFVDVLGFELVEDAPSSTNDGRQKRWVVVRPPGATTALLLAQADGEHQRGAVGHQFAGRVGFFLRVDNFDSAVKRMRGPAWNSLASHERSRTGGLLSSSTSPETGGTCSGQNRLTDRSPYDTGLERDP